MGQQQWVLFCDIYFVCVCFKGEGVGQQQWVLFCDIYFVCVCFKGEGVGQQQWVLFCDVYGASVWDYGCHLQSEWSSRLLILSRRHGPRLRSKQVSSCIQAYGLNRWAHVRSGPTV